MKLLSRAALAATAILSVPATAQTPLELAERLYERAAIAAQLAPIPAQFAQGLEPYRGKMPDEVIAALVEGGKKSFAEEALRGGIVSDIARKMKPDDIVKTLDWLDGLVGLGGTQLIRAGTGVGQANNPITGTVPGGYGDALSSLWGAGFPRWTVQLNVSYPLGNSSQEVNVARSKIQLNQASAQMRQVELQIATEVTNAAVAVQSNIERVQAAVSARELAQQQLEAERSKFQVGMSTNYLVIQAQRDLATAQNNELQAILNYRNSLVELDRLQQTTLQNLNVTVVGTATSAIR